MAKHFLVVVTQTNKVAVAQQLEEIQDVQEPHRWYRCWQAYNIGGRWLGYFKLKPGTTGRLGERTGDKARFDADIAKASDIDWAGMSQAAWAERGNMWKRAVAALKKRPNTPTDVLRERYDVREGDDMESYLARARAYPDAVLHNGELHGDWLGDYPGLRDVYYRKPPGWWKREVDSILADIAPDDELTAVDLIR
jgi:hypothetical protein